MFADAATDAALIDLLTKLVTLVIAPVVGGLLWWNRKQQGELDLARKEVSDLKYRLQTLQSTANIAARRDTNGNKDAPSLGG